MTRSTIAGIAPFFIVANVPATLSFYRDKLGFEVTFRGPSPEDEFVRWRLSSLRVAFVSQYL